jgi:hypothetical protein
MKSTEILKLKAGFEKAVEGYILAFCEKQDRTFDGWIGDLIGELADIGGYYVLNFDDIRFDVDNQVPAGLIFKWYEEILAEGKDMNYRHYVLKSLPFE